YLFLGVFPELFGVWIVLKRPNGDSPTRAYRPFLGEPTLSGLIPSKLRFREVIQYRTRCRLLIGEDQRLEYRAFQVFAGLVAMKEQPIDTCIVGGFQMANSQFLRDCRPGQHERQEYKKRARKSEPTHSQRIAIL